MKTKKRRSEMPTRISIIRFDEFTSEIFAEYSYVGHVISNKELELALKSGEFIDINNHNEVVEMSISTVTQQTKCVTAAAIEASPGTIKYKNKAQARRFMAQKVTKKIIEMVQAGDFVVPEQTCAATFTSNETLRAYALELADDVQSSGFSFSLSRFNGLQADAMRCMVLDDVFGFYSKTADDLRSKLREIQAAPVVAAPVVVVDALQSLHELSALAIVEPEPVTVLEVAPALVEPVTVSAVAKPLDDAATVSAVAKPLNDCLTINWDSCTIGMRELICDYGAINKNAASKSWCDIDDWLKLLLIDAANKTDSTERFNLIGDCKPQTTKATSIAPIQLTEAEHDAILKDIRNGNINEHTVNDTVKLYEEVKRSKQTPKPKPRGANLTKMARAGIMILGWFFTHELFAAAGQGKIREFLSQGLKMAWNFDALTVTDFARFFAQCTDDTKAAKVYALYCEVMPCPLSLEDLIGLYLP